MPKQKFVDYARFCAFQVAGLIDPDTSLVKLTKALDKRVYRVRLAPDAKKSGLLLAAQAAWNARMCEQPDIEDHMAVVYAEKASEFSAKALAKAAEAAGRDSAAAYEEAIDNQQSWLEFAAVG